MCRRVFQYLYLQLSSTMDLISVFQKEMTCTFCHLKLLSMIAEGWLLSSFFSLNYWLRMNLVLFNGYASNL